MKNLIFFFCLLQSLHGFGQIKETQAIDSIFSELNKPNVPGCALGIIKDGNLIYTKGYGMADLEHQIPNSINTLFDIGSNAKQFTAACIVLLVQKGKLNLDNKLSDFFPEFPSYANKITIRHLLNHTSGIRDYLTLQFLKSPGENKSYTDSEIMELLVNQKELNFQPGDKNLYSNSGYWLLGQIVNKITGMDLAAFAKKEIFEPLGMNSTDFQRNYSQIAKKMAYGYAPNGSGGFTISMPTNNEIGAGGIFTSIEDLKKWDEAFYQSKILNEDFWSIMLNKCVLNSGDTLGYACGLTISNYKGLNTKSHGGEIAGYHSEMMCFPDQRVTIILLANRLDVDPTGMCYKVADVLLKDQFKVQKNTSQNSELTRKDLESKYSLEQMSGTYAIQNGVNLQINRQDDSLHVNQTWNNISYKIGRTIGNTFQNPGFPNITFSFTNLQNGHSNLLLIYQEGRNHEWKRIEDRQLVQIKPEEYVGKYYCKELDVIYELTVMNDKLYALAGKMGPVELSAVDSDQFSYQGFAKVRFKRNDKLISGFELDMDRVLNLKFEKMK